MSSLFAYLYKQPIDNNITVLIALVLDIVVIIGLYKRILKEIKSLRNLK